MALTIQKYFRQRYKICQNKYFYFLFFSTCALFNNAVVYQGYVTSVINELNMNIEHWWKSNEREMSSY
jgi:hypothetical protein